MGKIKNFSISVDDEIVEKAKEQLLTGQKLSPVISFLLEEWIAKRIKEKEE